MDLKTMFDGWGTALITTIISLIVASGGIAFFRKGHIHQKQKGGRNSKQRQEVKNSSSKEVTQSQEGGDNSNQNQIA